MINDVYSDRVYINCKKCGFDFKDYKDIEHHNCLTTHINIINSVKVELYEKIISQKLGINFCESSSKTSGENLIEFLQTQFENGTFFKTEKKNPEISTTKKTITMKQINSPKKRKMLIPKTKEEIEEIKTYIYNVINKSPKNERRKVELTKLSKERYRLYGVVDYDEYITFTKNSIEVLTKILKESGIKNVEACVTASLTKIDLRLLQYWKENNVCLTQLELQDIDKYNLFLDSFTLKFMSCFDINSIFKNLLNYGLIVKPLENRLEKVLINKDYPIVIYVKNEDEKEEEKENPFLFYILTDIDGINRKWKFDSRLENISYELSSKMTLYLIDIFKGLYYNIYKTNNFMENFDKSDLHQELIMILKTLLIVYDPIHFAKFLQNLIIKHCLYIPREKDKIVIYSDNNTVQFSKFNKMCSLNEIKVDIAKDLFESLNEEDCKKFCKMV